MILRGVKVTDDGRGMSYINPLKCHLSCVRVQKSQRLPFSSGFSAKSST